MTGMKKIVGMMKRTKMKLDSYTISKMQDQIAQFLFIKWLEGGLWDSNHPEIKELYENYHAIMIKQVDVIDD